MKKPRHKARIKAYLLENGFITPLIAEKIFHCHRLAAVIYRLRKEGMNIITTTHNKKNVWGEDVSYAEYVYTTLPIDNSNLRIK